MRPAALVIMTVVLVMVIVVMGIVVMGIVVMTVMGVVVLVFAGMLGTHRAPMAKRARSRRTVALTINTATTCSAFWLTPQDTCVTCPS